MTRTFPTHRRLAVSGLLVILFWGVAPRLCSGQRPESYFDLSNAAVPKREIRSGGPPKDGIPAITHRRFVQADRAHFLRPSDRVIGVVIGNEARAYPLKILERHEAVNDSLGEVPFAVTYCPLCDSSAVFDRRLGEKPVELGISGLLYNSNVLLYDRSGRGRESLWSQMASQAVAGPRRGRTLTTLPLEVTTFGDWKRRHPQAEVLSTNTGYRRNYDRSAYARYYNSPRLMFPVRPLDKRLPLKTRVLGVWTKDAARAYPVAALSEAGEDGRMEQELDGRSFTVRVNPKAESLRIEQAEGGLQWVYSYWFAWAAFHPQTEIHKPGR